MREVPAAPFSVRGEGKKHRGVQIDLLIQTAKTAYIVEVKRRHRIDGEVIAELEQKVASFPHRRDLTIRTVLVYEGEPEDAVKKSEALDFLIPVSTLLRS